MKDDVEPVAQRHSSQMYPAGMSGGGSEEQQEEKLHQFSPSAYAVILVLCAVVLVSIVAVFGAMRLRRSLQKKTVMVDELEWDGSLDGSHMHIRENPFESQVSFGCWLFGGVEFWFFFCLTQLIIPDDVQVIDEDSGSEIDEEEEMVTMIKAKRSTSDNEDQMEWDNSLYK